MKIKIYVKHTRYTNYYELRMKESHMWHERDQIDGIWVANLNSRDSVAHQDNDDGRHHQYQNDDSDTRNFLVARVL